MGIQRGKVCGKVTELGPTSGLRIQLSTPWPPLWGLTRQSVVSFLEFEELPSGVSSDSGEITLKICNLMPQDSGIYTCIATNDHGTTSTSATVKVQGTVSLLVKHFLSFFTIYFVVW